MMVKVKGAGAAAPSSCKGCSLQPSLSFSGQWAGAQIANQGFRGVGGTKAPSTSSGGGP